MCQTLGICFMTLIKKQRDGTDVFQQEFGNCLWAEQHCPMTLRIIEHLLICSDCYNGIRVMSKIVELKIVVLDNKIFIISGMGSVHVDITGSGGV